MTIKDATITEVKAFFGVNATELMKQWKLLSEAEQAFFKREVGKVINK